MANSYTWYIDRMEAVVGPDSHGHENSIIRVDWVLWASDEDGHKTHYSGSTQLEWESGPWTEFSDITESQVIGWVEGALGSDLATIKQELDSVISEEQGKPAIQQVDRMPWAPQDSEEEGDGE
tara:strand:+ start:392 stop:760 length:369 start_codon:yes stop_codon:yes gene_type:complete